MKVPAAQTGPPLPVILVAGIAAIILMALIAKTFVGLLYAVLQLALLVIGFVGVFWLGNYLLRQVKP